ncbi:hypothetical protein [Methylotenera sp.]|uniref:hypothetical protein n=1 Tax=Methylotenera sp. TaxID=2051956 RepID=UPI00273463C6|nr:hypothetical protein [Methylotenera sp.]MDP3212134.1 hypothetical protein [Methylotenera sp.]MDP3309073.1 hypothetical protein [Methylotenera sp.]
MKKHTLLALVLLTGASLAQAGEAASADTAAKSFINGYLGKSRPHTGPAGHEKPSVDKNLAIGAASVLGTGVRHTGPAGNEKPSVDRNLAIGAASVLGTGIRLPSPVSNTK